MDELLKLKKELKDLNAEYAKIREIAPEKRGEFGRELNAKKLAILEKIRLAEEAELDVSVKPLDITAPCGVNEAMPNTYSVFQGSRHPLTTELGRVVSIYQMMGFDVVESRQLDDEYHMFY